MDNLFTTILCLFIFLTGYSQSTVTWKVLTPDGIPLEGAMIDSVTTDKNGEVIIVYNVTSPQIIKVQNASFADKPSRCISLNDFKLLTEHIEGRNNLPVSANIAADVNNNESISAADGSAIRKIILNDDYPWGNQWGFYHPESFKVPSVEVQGNGDMVTQVITAIKKGNVDEDYNCLVTSSKDYLFLNLNVSPNPVSNSLSILNVRLERVDVINISGFSVNIEVNNNQVDMSGLPSGSYFVKGMNLTNGDVYLAKIIKL